VLESLNGEVQVSDATDSSTIGLLVNRGDWAAGTLLTREQAKQLAELLTRQFRLTGAPAHQSAGT